MPEENMNGEYRLKRIDEIRNYIIEEINRNELISTKHKNVSRVLNYIDYSLIGISIFTGCVSISAFASLVGFTIGTASSTIWLEICVITAGIKKYKLIIKKKKKKDDKIVLLAKLKLNNIEVLISKALIDWNITHDELAFINKVLRDVYDMKEEIKNSNNK